MNAEALKWIAEHAKDFAHAEELADAMRFAYADAARVCDAMRQEKDDLDASAPQYVEAWQDATDIASSRITDRAALPADGRGHE